MLSKTYGKGLPIKINLLPRTLIFEVDVRTFMLITPTTMKRS